MISYDIKKQICIWLLLLCMISAVMTGTLAWKDYSQHKSNEFSGVSLHEMGSAALLKLDKETGRPLAGIEFELHMLDEDGSDICVGGIYSTDENGMIWVDNLEEKEYYWLEIEPDHGWAYDRDENNNEIREYHFTEETNGNGILMPIIVKAYNQRLYADLIVTKRVEGQNAPEPDDGQGPPDTGQEPTTGREEQSADQELIRENNEDPEDASNTTEDQGGIALLVRLQEQDESGETILKDTIAETGDEAQGADTVIAGGQEQENNTVTGGGQNENVYSGAAAALTAERFEFIVTFEGVEDGPVIVLIGGVELEGAEIINGKLVFGLEDGQTAVIKDLPVGASYIVEEKPADGYIGVSDNNKGEIPPEGAAVNFVNYFDMSGKLIVKKIVIGEGADTDKSFGFTVIINGEETRFDLKGGEEREFPLAPGDIWSVTEEDYRKDGYEPGYIIDHSIADGIAVIEYLRINRFVGPDLIVIKGEKTWDPVGVIAGLPESITLHLMDGETIVATVYVKPDENGRWHYTFPAVPKYRDDGETEIIYTVREVPVPGFFAAVNGYDIHNIYIPAEGGVETIVVPPVKKLINGNPKENVTFSFRLVAQGAAPMPAGSVGSVKLITIKGAGEGNFGEINYIDPGVYHYTISEVIADKTGWTYDKTVYNLVVTVTLKGDELVATKTLTKINGTTVSEKAAFTNTYYEKPPKPERPSDPGNSDRPKTGDSSSIWLWAITMTASAITLRALLLYRSPKGAESYN